MRKIRRRPEGFDSPEKYASGAEATANRVTATLLLFIAEVYIFVWMLFVCGVVHSNMKLALLILPGSSLVLVAIALPGLLRWVTSPRYKYLLMNSLLISTAGVNFLTGYKTWMLMAVPMVLACRYSSKRLVWHCGINAMFFSLVCGFLNVFVSPSVGIMDMNTVSFSEQTAFTARISDFLYAVVQEQPFDTLTVLKNTLLLSVLPNMMILFLLTQICCAVVLYHEQQTEETRRRLEAEAALKLQLSESRTRITLSQIQPHFLYNSLTAIMAIDGNPDETVDALGEFGKYLRENMSILTCPDMIPFSREIIHVRHYLDLEQLRFRERLHVVYDLRTMDFQLPPLTVQMLAENAVRHGLTPRASGGTLTIMTEETEDGFRITVSDDGVGYDPEKASRDEKHIGLSNVESRLKAFCGGSFSIEGSPGAGTSATVLIPKKGRNPA